jgi:hypothetical protein
MSRTRLRPYGGVCILVLLVVIATYGAYRLNLLPSQTGPLTPQQVLYRSEEVLRLPPGANPHTQSIPAPFDRPFVIFMGTRSTPVRIMVYNLTFANQSGNTTDVHLSLRAENLGVVPVCVFHERDLWFLEATEYRLRYDASVAPTLILQPLEIGHASVKFTLSSSVQPDSVVWMIWTGAGWWRIAVVVPIS